MIAFGTGGWRAIIGEEFTKENVSRLALAVARRMRAEGADERGIAIGFDRRFLSREAAKWAAEVMAAEGVRTHFIAREAPTPLVMFTVKAMGLDYGMAVTASHNPALYNGVKLFTRGGRDASLEVTEPLGAAASAIGRAEIRAVRYEDAVTRGLVTEIAPENRYLDTIIETLDMEKIRGRNLSIVLDPMYGVSRTSLQTILLTARCDVDVIHERHDALFGGRLPSPNAETLGALRAAVTERGADIGIATDGDADRIGIIDDCGRFVHPNEILVLLYYYLLKYKGFRGPAVRNLATTHLLDRVAAAFGEKCYEVPVGFKHISAEMEKRGAIIGGESSGGLAVKGHIPGKDGIQAAALLVEMMAVTGAPLSALTRRIYVEFGEAYMAEYDWPFLPEERARLEALLLKEKALPVFPERVEGVSYMDGVKVLFSEGWLIVRFSGTEPRLRVFCEMPNRIRAEKLCLAAAQFLGMKL